MKRVMICVLLVLAGGLLMLIGGFALFFADAFFGSNGIVLPNDPSLRSEMRAPMGLLLVSGIIIAASAFRRSLAPLGLALAAMVYGTYGLSRMVSLGLDGAPSEGLVSAMLIELVLGALALLGLLMAPFDAKRRNLSAGLPLTKVDKLPGEPLQFAGGVHSSDLRPKGS